MERGTNVPMTAGGLVGKLYAHTPHHRIDQMHAATTTNLNLLAYKRCIEVAAALFVLGLVSMASCWGFLTWVGLPHLLCVLYPYCNQVLHPTFYFIYTIVVAVFTFVNLCGGLSHGCLIVPVLVEMPMLVLSGLLCYHISVVDPTIQQHLRTFLRPRQQTQPAMTTHHMSAAPSDMSQVVVAAQPAVVGVPVAIVQQPSVPAAGFDKV